MYGQVLDENVVIILEFEVISSVLRPIAGATLKLSSAFPVNLQ
jgi:hypothetical protein